MGSLDADSNNAHCCSCTVGGYLKTEPLKGTRPITDVLVQTGDANAP